MSDTVHSRYSCLGYMFSCESKFYSRFGFSVVAPLTSAQCVDGTYKHEGRDCCLCPAGTSAVDAYLMYFNPSWSQSLSVYTQK